MRHKGYKLDLCLNQNMDPSWATQTLPFTEFNFLQKYREGFKKSELGMINQKLPCAHMAGAIRLRIPAKERFSCLDGYPFLDLQGFLANLKVELGFCKCFLQIKKSICNFALCMSRNSND